MDCAKRTILLVDDDLDFLEMNRKLLETHGFEVHCCSDPHEALKLMRQRRPGLVVADLMMRSLDSGFLLSREIKEDPELRRIPVIIVTAAGSRMGFDFNPCARDDLKEMRADAFFEKPAAQAEFLSKIRELLGPPESEKGET